MIFKQEQGDFGYCPRVFCDSTPCLPLGLSPVPGLNCVKLFCPLCREIYKPRSSRHAQTDGAFFGISLCINTSIRFYRYRRFLLPAAAADDAPGAAAGSPRPPVRAQTVRVPGVFPGPPDTEATGDRCSEYSDKFSVTY